MSVSSKYILRTIGNINYDDALSKMRDFTINRDSDTTDEIWIVEHPPVFTQGQAGKSEHILKPSDIPIIQSDRGGQVTYHGPGQLIIYFLIDLKRKPFSIRDLVCKMEQIIIDFLSDKGISAHRKEKAPGVYVNEAKVCSLGIRVRKGCSYHGLSFNIDMDLTPFQYINPCGYENLEVTQLVDLVGDKKITDKQKVTTNILNLIDKHLEYSSKVDITKANA